MNRLTKKPIAYIAVILIIVSALTFVFTACNKEGTEAQPSVTVTVTDKNGELVTDSEGKPVTEVVTTGTSSGKTTSNPSGTAKPTSANTTSSANQTTKKPSSTGAQTTTKKPSATKPTENTTSTTSSYMDDEVPGEWTNFY